MVYSVAAAGRLAASAHAAPPVPVPGARAEGISSSAQTVPICPAIVSVATRIPSGSKSAPSIVAADRRAALPRETVARVGIG